MLANGPMNGSVEEKMRRVVKQSRKVHRKAEQKSSGLKKQKLRTNPKPGKIVGNGQRR